MAGEKRVELPPHVWTDLTGGNITSTVTISFHGPTVKLAAEASPTLPAENESITFDRGERVVALKLSDLFPDITSPNRLYAKPNGDVSSALYISWN